MPTIQFLTMDFQFNALPHPYPANRHIPDWFKNMPQEAQANNQTGATLKRCPPFLEAMTAGYIIPVPFDIELSVSPDGVVTPRCQYKIVSGHFPVQYAGSPFSGMAVLKFHNPWVIVTPPGYACLITAPINRLGSPILPLTGLVETDSYYREIHFPSIIMLPKGQKAILKRGQPLAQVIPIKIEPWTARAGIADTQKRADAEQPFHKDAHHYKAAFWKKLEYTWEDTPPVARASRP